jgi:hypothetical protein
MLNIGLNEDMPCVPNSYFKRFYICPCLKSLGEYVPHCKNIQTIQTILNTAKEMDYLHIILFIAKFQISTKLFEISIKMNKFMRSKNFLGERG